MKRVALLIALTFTASPASYSTSANEVEWVFDLSGKGGFFDLPFPTEMRRMDDGTIDMKNFPNPLGLKMVKRPVIGNSV